MEDVDALLTELARSHGEEILGLRWGAVLAACESEPGAMATERNPTSTSFCPTTTNSQKKNCGSYSL